MAFSHSFFFRVPRIKGRNRNPAGANRAKTRFRGHVGDPAGVNRAKRRFRGHVGDPVGGLYFCIRGEKAKKGSGVKVCV